MTELQNNNNNNKQTYYYSATASSYFYIANDIIKKKSENLIFICHNDQELNKLTSNLKFFCNNIDINIFPAWDCLAYDRISPSNKIMNDRIKCLYNLSINKSKKRQIIFTTINALIQKIILPEKILEHIFELKKNDNIDLNILSLKLVNIGYNNVSEVTDIGEFAIRGGLMDIFPVGSENPVRIDFFGNKIENIKIFDPSTQISNEKIDHIKLMPLGEVIINEENKERFLDNYVKIFKISQLSNDPLYTSIATNRKYIGIEHYIALFYEELTDIFHYIDKPEIILLPQITENIEVNLNKINDLYQTRLSASKYKTFSDNIYNPLAPHYLYLKQEDLNKIFANHNISYLNQFTRPDILPVKINIDHFDYAIEYTPNFYNRALETHQSAFELFKDFIQNQKKPIIIAAMSQGSQARILHILDKYELKAQIIDNYVGVKNNKFKSSVFISILDVSQGFICNDFIIITEEDLFGERLATTVKKSNKSSEKLLQESNSLNTGEYVVHIEYGIGRYEGLQIIEVSGAKHDCLKIAYADNDILYIPVENLELISRYGSNDGFIKLDKLNSNSWKLRKANLKKRIKICAEKLINLAAERELIEANIFSAPIDLYEEFCAKFPYAETDDQLSAINDIENDLSSGYIMDRLICGDVGFGKTEVAMRAAFIVTGNNIAEKKDGNRNVLNILEDPKNLNATPQLTSDSSNNFKLAHEDQVPGAINFEDRNVLNILEDPKNLNATPQLTSGVEFKNVVAVIVPTTLLCRQHYKNFKERFANFPIKIKQLSRMVTKTEADKIKEELRNGEIDIIIGTHSLLSDSIIFKNLKLVIIDEEQHFGVKQKEKLKELQSDIHVLSLSATPIPRTLQMSLAGVKNLSLIATPPVDRLSVRTYVMPFDPVIIREAILREHYRGGSSFVVCHFIKDLNILYNKLVELIPEVKIVIAHGQMPSNQLENIINGFYDRQYDVLLSTTIIESGLDIPTANTMIIYNADDFGLSQLYQLRGRVGRSKVRGYAYLTYNTKKSLSETATKRLEVMGKCDSLGAGFSIATHDMDIRGFGNIIGDEQSGHIKEIGIELYQSLLNDAVLELKNSGIDIQNKDWTPQINISIPIYIPDEYVQDLQLRLSLYRRISLLKDEKDINNFIIELVDRFGSAPESVHNLLEIMSIKINCKLLNIEKIDVGNKGILISFKDNYFANPEGLINFLQKNRHWTKLRPDQKIFFNRDLSNKSKHLSAIQEIINLLKNL